MPSVEAELSFMALVEKQDMFGMELYKCHFENGSVCKLGFNKQGISIHRPNSSTRDGFRWENLLDLGYKKKKLSVIYISPDSFDKVRIVFIFEAKEAAKVRVAHKHRGTLRPTLRNVAIILFVYSPICKQARCCMCPRINHHCFRRALFVVCACVCCSTCGPVRFSTTHFFRADDGPHQRKTSGAQSHPRRCGMGAVLLIAAVGANSVVLPALLPLPLPLPHPLPLTLTLTLTLTPLLSDFGGTLGLVWSPFLAPPCFAQGTTLNQAVESSQRRANEIKVRGCLAPFSRLRRGCSLPCWPGCL